MKASSYMYLTTLVVYLSIKMMEVSGLPDFAATGFIPNMFEGETDNKKWEFLGHVDPSSGSSGGGNVFGQRAVEVFRETNDLKEVWPRICGEDADQDGITNGEALCDPECKFVYDPNKNKGQSVIPCADGVTLLHPGLSGANILIFLHAALMILAWVFFAPLGIVAAIIFKKSGPPPTWFKVHRYALSIAVVLTLGGFFAILGFVKGFRFNDNHVYFGLAVVVGSILQPLSGFLRPHLPKKGVRKSSERLLWELQHQWTGRLVLVLAIASVISGLELFFNTPSARLGGLALAALFGIGAVFCFSYVLLFRDRRSASSGNNFNKSDTEIKYQIAAEVPSQRVVTTAVEVKQGRDEQKDLGNDELPNNEQVETVALRELEAKGNVSKKSLREMEGSSVKRNLPLAAEAIIDESRTPSKKTFQDFSV